MTTAMSYGYKELQATYNRTMARAMMLSTSLVLALVAAYQLAQFLQSRVDDIGIHDTKITIIDLTKLPTPTIGISVPAIPMTGIKPSYGVPVPVPDGDVKPDEHFATIDELKASPAPIGMTGEEAGDNIQIVIPKESEIDPDPYRFIPVEEIPVPVLNPAPVYPELALRANIEGTVFVKMLVQKDGTVKRAFVEKSNAEILNDAALEAAARWTFRPALMNHRPVPVWVSVPFRFHLR